MKTKIKISRRSAEEMRSFIEEWESSGESKKSFCARRGLAPSTLHYWCSKLQIESKQHERAFIEVKPTLKSNSHVPIEIIFPSGAKIILSPSTDLSIIRSIIY